MAGEEVTKMFEIVLTRFVRNADEMLVGKRFAVGVLGMTWQPCIHVRTQQMHQYLPAKQHNAALFYHTCLTSVVAWPCDS